MIVIIWIRKACLHWQWHKPALVVFLLTITMLFRVHTKKIRIAIPGMIVIEKIGHGRKTALEITKRTGIEMNVGTTGMIEVEITETNQIRSIEVTDIGRNEAAITERIVDGTTEKVPIGKTEKRIGTGRRTGKGIDIEKMAVKVVIEIVSLTNTKAVIRNVIEKGIAKRRRKKGAHVLGRKIGLIRSTAMAAKIVTVRSIRSTKSTKKRNGPAVMSVTAHTKSTRNVIGMPESPPLNVISVVKKSVRNGLDMMTSVIDRIQLFYGPFTNRSRGIWAWIRNQSCFLWLVITHPCRNFNGSLAKLLSKLGHGWMITTQFYVDVVTYPCLKLRAGLTHFCE